MMKHAWFQQQAYQLLKRWSWRHHYWPYLVVKSNLQGQPARFTTNCRKYHPQGLNSLIGRGRNLEEQWEKPTRSKMIFGAFIFWTFDFNNIYKLISILIYDMSLALLFVFENTVFIFCFNFKNCVKCYDTILGKYDSYLPNFEIIDFRASGLLSFRIVKFLDCEASGLWSFWGFKTSKIAKSDYLIGCILNQYS